MIEAINLTKKFENNIALNSANLKIPSGSIFGLVGSNGSGKSTLLRLISGVYAPDSGEICIDKERPFNNAKKKSEICYLPDTPYFLHQSDLDEMAKFYAGIWQSFSFEKYNELLKAFPLNNKHRISQMSKGMQRQAALILSLAACPKYLLLDESLDGLDPVMRRVLKSILIDCAENGTTTVISSHSMRDVDNLCDNVALLHRGESILAGNLAAIKEDIHKIQMAFEKTPEETVFSGLHLLKIERTGRLITMVVKGQKQELEHKIKQLSPLFADFLEPSFEEIFLYELEAKGYDAANILK